MARFDTGVSRYIKAQAMVEVGFPVDWRGSVEIACKHCPYFSRSTGRCNLTQSVVNFPDKFVGEQCPLEPIEEEVQENA